MPKFITQRFEGKEVTLIQDENGVRIDIGDYFILKIGDDGAVHLYEGVDTDETGLTVDTRGFVKVVSDL